MRGFLASSLVFFPLSVVAAGCLYRPDDCWHMSTCPYDDADAAASSDGSAADVTADVSSVPPPLDGGSDAKQPRDSGPDASSPDARPDGSPGDATPPCDPTVAPATNPCVVDETYGFFVSPTGNDNGDGTRASPFATLKRASERAKFKNKPLVFACAGNYQLAEILGAASDGTKLYGGFDCTSWKYDLANKVLVAPSSSPALIVESIAQALTFEDIAFVSPAATSEGGSSIAVLVRSSQNIVFRRSSMTAGDATKGADGTSDSNSWSGQATRGNTGVGATGGATLASCTCGGTGGKGGDAGKWDSTAGTPLTPVASDGESGTIGASNLGTRASVPPYTICKAGGAGAPGLPGSGGTGGASVGVLSVDGWSNPSGAGGLGISGGAAQGGGGGGGALYDPSDVPGGSKGAGGGGCGGCGGALGRGGQPGGSSIALVSLSSSITLDTSSLTAAKGGPGGKGGDGQDGQTGGDGGGPATTGCSGGKGGIGGAGGGGGGGAGGHSIAIAYLGRQPADVGAVSKNIAASAAAGGQPGKNGSSSSGTGAAGVSAASRVFY